MSKKKFLFVGSKGCGKTSLIYALLGQYELGMRITSTQSMTGYGSYIDLPGNYCDNPGCYPILSVCSQQAYAVVLVVAAHQQSMLMPEGFANLFIRPVFGVVTQIDVPNADCARTELFLSRTGAKGPYYNVSARTGIGIASFGKFLEEL